MTGRSAAGAVLLEVVVALAILALAGVLAVSGTSQAMTSVRLAREREEAISAASRFLDRVALWPREDLDRRLGRRRQGPWILVTSRPVETLYLVSLIDSATSETLVETALYRQGADTDAGG